MAQGRNERYQPDISGVLEKVDSLFVAPGGFSSGMWLQAMWPWMFAAAFMGIAFELAKWAILNMRRPVYNCNRNLRYAQKNQAWRTDAKKQGKYHRKVPLPVPPDFVEDLCRQWNKVHDSLEEMLKFGMMLIELDDYVDNSFIFDDNDNIVGRMPGMKGFLSEHCPHVGYKTAMRYRSLALKARELESQGKITEIQGKCGTVHELEKRLDRSLGIVPRHLKPHHRPRRRHRAPDNPIFSLREQTRSALSHLDTSERLRFVAGLQELVREISVS
jgi:hypothetical protein